MKLFLQPNAELANDYFELSVVNGFDINSIKDLLGKEFFEKNDTANKNYGVFAVDKDEDFNKLIEGYDVIFCGNSKLRKVGKICWKAVSLPIARKIWHDENMKYIYVVENPVDLDININEFYKIMKYKEGYKVRNVLSFNDDDRGDEIIRVYALMDRAFPETGDVASVKKMAAKAVVAKPVVEEIPPLAMHELDDKQVKMIGKCFAKNYKKGKISAKYQQMRSDNNNLLISNLLGDQQTFQCCFCRKVFNLAMLNPVCIKPITACQANEIKDVAHNTIFLCKTGCEALFSNGFVVVNETGTIKRNAENAAVTDDLSREIGHLNNKVVTVYDDTNKKYFADHFAQYSKK